MTLLCIATGIVFEAYSPLGNPSRPSKSSQEPVVLDDPVINEIAKKYNATPAQVRALVATIYSGKESTEKRITSKLSGPFILTHEKRSISQLRTKWPPPMCPLLRGSTVTSYITILPLGLHFIYSPSWHGGDSQNSESC